jgi:hypothetical protein
MSAPRGAVARFELVYTVEAAAAEIVATLPQEIRLEAASGTPPYTWRLVGGALPLGLDLSGAGVIRGAAIELGTFVLEVEAQDANGLAAEGTLTLLSTAPEIPIESLLSPFLLTGPELTPAQLTFLNQQGNGVGGYDLGDLRAWILANPDLPMRADLESLLQPRTIVIPGPRPPGGTSPEAIR